MGGGGGEGMGSGEREGQISQDNRAMFTTSGYLYACRQRTAYIYLGKPDLCEPRAFRLDPAEKPAAGQRLWLCFDGVDWEAQVYLNGELLGSHRVYYEPFRFDVTDKIRQDNTLAVRVLAGRSYGEPMTYWAVFPDIRALQQRYVPDRAGSIIGNLPIGYHAGCGFGIHRDAYLELTGPVLVAGIFARNDGSNDQARLRVEVDAATACAVEMKVQIMPENCEGRAYEKTLSAPLPRGRSVQSLVVPMPEAQVWSPDTPNLYRCRVTARNAGGQSDAKDVLFGCRNFTLVNRSEKPAHGRTPGPRAERGDLPNGMLLLNGKPVFLRGTNIQGLNAYAYWGQTEELLHTVLLLKAGNFNIVRSCQHVEFPEVRECYDRLGMMSEQDQGGGYRGSIDMGIRREPHIHTGTVLARQCYNNPAVVFLCFGNEHEFDAAPILRAALAVDPQRIIIGHTDRDLDWDYHIGLLQTGVNLIYDQLSKEKYQPDSKRVEFILKLVKAGFGKQIMLSGDLARKSYWPSYGNWGGPGLTYILWRFVPWLHA